MISDRTNRTIFLALALGAVTLAVAVAALIFVVLLEPEPTEEHPLDEEQKIRLGWLPSVSGVLVEADPRGQWIMINQRPQAEEDDEEFTEEPLLQRIFVNRQTEYVFVRRTIVSHGTEVVGGFVFHGEPEETEETFSISFGDLAVGAHVSVRFGERVDMAREDPVAKQVVVVEVIDLENK